MSAPLLLCCSPLLDLQSLDLDLVLVPGQCSESARMNSQQIDVSCLSQRCKAEKCNQKYIRCFFFFSVISPTCFAGFKAERTAGDDGAEVK